MILNSLKIEYPNLPVVEHKKEFMSLLKNHQVVIVKADTGSGKSTQIPKFLLEFFLSNGRFKIGVTEPRRLAAISIADRLRDELKDNSLVSTKIRFWEEGSKNAPIKVMTDGILLQEFRRDKLFYNYNAIMIDEAHERSLNIDILLGIFKNVLAIRKDFKLIIASATLDAMLFESFYNNSCVMEAEGRTFPVKVEYYFQSNVSGKKNLEEFKDEIFENSYGSGKGDSLVIEEARDAIIDLETRFQDNLLCFLPTERDIQDLADELRHDLNSSFDILPLFGRMSPEEQRKVFRETSKTRIVLATNIAETSLTIPGIAYVVDTGMARISRYNAQTRIQGLPIEKISKASARQRTGRAGRVKPGICIRLYSEDDFEKREDFTEPEIKRSNLANVVLQLKSLGLELETFPFLQAPKHSAFKGAYKVLHELGAITSGDANGHVTKLGREISSIPMDVSLSAVLLRSRDSGVLQPALIVCAALSIQDPRVIPNEEQQRTKVRQLHRKYFGHKSDFIVFISIWNDFCTDWDGKSWNKLRKFCDKNSMHFLRLREWVDLYEQFSRILNVKFENRVCLFENFHRDNLHIVLLSGFLGGIARRDLENSCYRLVNGRETYMFPGSDLYAKHAEWIFSAEVRETSRVFLTKSAEIKPEWILQVAEPFCTKRYFEPVWNKNRGFVEAIEEVSFRGLVISRGRKIDYARINSEDSSQIFWREAIVLGEISHPFSFMIHNNKVVENLQALETRKRKFGIAPTEDDLIEYYTRIAYNVNSVKSLKEYIIKHTDQFLKFDENYWLESKKINFFIDDYQKTIQKSLFKNNLGDFWNNPSVKQIKKENSNIQKNIQRGIAIDNFRIENHLIKGEIVFDALQKNDGITLYFPYNLLSEIIPSKLALSLPQWREWMIDSILREMPKVLKESFEKKKNVLDDYFCESLENNLFKAPLLLLYEVLKNTKEYTSFLNSQNDNYSLSTINPENEHHLRLHIKIVKSNSQEELLIELSPEWGCYQMFYALKSIIESLNLDYPLQNMRYGFCSDGFRLMTSVESNFWQNFRRRILSSSLLNGLNVLELESNEKSLYKQNNPLISLIKDRLNLLELGGLYSDGFCTASKVLVLKSLIADKLDANLCVRFSGLEFSHGKKIHDFKSLALKTRSEDEKVKLSLVKATYESGLLGGSYFIKYWNLLKDFSISIRKDYNKTFFQNLKVISLHKLYQKNLSLYERLVELKNIINEKHLVREPSLLKKLDKQSILELRDSFRPFIKSRFLKDNEIKNIRDLLQSIEKTSIESKNFVDLYLQLKALLEKTEILRYKRHLLDIEDIVDAHSLAKLKGRFGKIQ